MGTRNGGLQLAVLFPSMQHTKRDDSQSRGFLIVPSLFDVMMVQECMRVGVVQSLVVSCLHCDGVAAARE
eukprot:scaffold18449_cov27-Tisochrysis_lutea.AAC.4